MIFLIKNQVINSFIWTVMVNKIFDNVVDGLEKGAKKLHMTYNEINVYGMFAWIGVTAGLAAKVISDNKKLKKLKK